MAAVDASRVQANYVFFSNQPSLCPVSKNHQFWSGVKIEPSGILRIVEVVADPVPGPDRNEQVRVALGRVLSWNETAMDNNETVIFDKTWQVGHPSERVIKARLQIVAQALKFGVIRSGVYAVQKIVFVIANDGFRVETPNQVKHLERSEPPIDEITNENEPVIDRRVGQQFQKIHQLIVTPVNIADNDYSFHG